MLVKDSQMANRFVIVIAALLFELGCSSTAMTEVDRDTERLSLLGRTYANYLAKYDGAPPPNEKRLKDFFESQQLQLSKFGLTRVDELLISPRDKEPLVVIYGKESLVEGPGGLPWVAYERTGVAGERYVVGARGSVETMTDEQIEKTFLGAGT